MKILNFDLNGLVQNEINSKQNFLKKYSTKNRASCLLTYSSDIFTLRIKIDINVDTKEWQLSLRIIFNRWRYNRVVGGIWRVRLHKRDSTCNPSLMAQQRDANTFYDKVSQQFRAINKRISCDQTLWRANPSQLQQHQPTNPLH